MWHDGDGEGRVETAAGRRTAGEWGLGHTGQADTCCGQAKAYILMAQSGENPRQRTSADDLEEEMVSVMVVVFSPACT